MVNDQLPDGLTTTDGRSMVSADVGTLEAGEARQVQFAVKASRTGTFENTATADAAGGLTAQDSCTTVVRQPVLTVTKAGPDMRFIGRPVNYDITVTNDGDVAARDTVLVDRVPADTQFVSASDGGQFSQGTVTWSLGTLAPGASRTVTLNLKALRAGTARNTASATAVCAQGEAAIETVLRGIPGILLEVIDVSDPIEVGAGETFEITVTNQGSADATNVTLECELDTEMDFVSTTGPTGETVEGKVVRFAPLPVLAPKAKATWRLMAKGVSAGDSRFRVTMECDQITRPVQETESTNVYE